MDDAGRSTLGRSPAVDAVDLATAAAHLGVHYQTAYRWVRSGELPSTKVANAYVISSDALEEFATARSQRQTAPTRLRVRDWEHQVERLHTFLLAGDELDARAMVDRLHEGGVPVIDLGDRLIAPTLHRIGLEWFTGDVSIAAEHVASQICERLLARVMPSPRGRPRGTVVVATLEGEQHYLPSSLATAALREAHWRVTHLGTAAPAPEIERAVLSTGADLLVISVTSPVSQPARDDVLVRMAACDVPVLLGAPGCTLHQLVAEAAAARKRARPAASAAPAATVMPSAAAGSVPPVSFGDAIDLGWQRRSGT